MAPHPDDEIFGAAGLLQSLLVRGISLEIVAVSDGEASHPSAPWRGIDLRSVRERETVHALQRLGWKAPTVTRLGLPDGQIARNFEALVASLRAECGRGTLPGSVARWPSGS